MKKTYIEPKVKEIRFIGEQILTASQGFGGNANDGDEGDAKEELDGGPFGW